LTDQKKRQMILNRGIWADDQQRSAIILKILPASQQKWKTRTQIQNNQDIGRYCQAKIFQWQSDPRLEQIMEWDTFGGDSQWLQNQSWALWD